MSEWLADPENWGRPGARGKFAATFHYENEPHTVDLSWASGNIFYFPYVLSIDQIVLEDSRALVRNWIMTPVSLISLCAFIEVLLVVISYIFGLRG